MKLHTMTMLVLVFIGVLSACGKQSDEAATSMGQSNVLDQATNAVESAKEAGSAAMDATSEAVGNSVDAVQDAAVNAAEDMSKEIKP